MTFFRSCNGLNVSPAIARERRKRKKGENKQEGISEMAGRRIRGYGSTKTIRKKDESHSLMCKNLLRIIL
jgi:hypothetical protein